MIGVAIALWWSADVVVYFVERSRKRKREARIVELEAENEALQRLINGIPAWQLQALWALNRER